MEDKKEIVDLGDALLPLTHMSLERMQLIQLINIKCITIIMSLIDDKESDDYLKLIKDYYSIHQSQT